MKAVKALRLEDMRIVLPVPRKSLALAWCVQKRMPYPCATSAVLTQQTSWKASGIDVRGWIR